MCQKLLLHIDSLVLPFETDGILYEIRISYPCSSETLWARMLMTMGMWISIDNNKEHKPIPLTVHSAIWQQAWF